MVLTVSALPVLAPAAPLAPSLTPTAQPTISLLSDTNTDSLSVDSLTLLPPADPPCLRHFTPDTHSVEHRQDVPALSEEHGSHPDPDVGEIGDDDGPYPDFEPANLSEIDVSSRDTLETETSAADPEENLDLEQETEID